MIESLHQAKYFTSLDAASGYWQIPVAEEDQPKTAFTCTEGLFEFSVMPFGLCNAPATYQRAMQQVLSPMLWKYALVYIDDVLVYSSTFEEHVRHVRAVLQVIRKAGFLLKAKKLQVGFTEIDFLGYRISAKGLFPQPKKIAALRDYPVPTSVKAVRAFLGSTGYYRRFIDKYAEMAAPLYELTDNSKYEWNEKHEKAFTSLKKALETQVVLAHPQFGKPFIVDTDASDIGLAGILSQ